MSNTSKMKRRRSPPDAAVQFLVVLPADQIKSLKIMALERNVTASTLLAEALAVWLKRSKAARSAALQLSSGEEKRQFLSKLDADLVRDTKQLAIDWMVSASSIVAQALSEWLRSHNKRK